MVEGSSADWRGFSQHSTACLDEFNEGQGIF